VKRRPASQKDQNKEGISINGGGGAARLGCRILQGCEESAQGGQLEGAAKRKKKYRKRTIQGESQMVVLSEKLIKRGGNLKKISVEVLK